VKTIYVVQGSTGEYSDRTEWLVCAYGDEESAKAHVVRAGRRANEIEEWRCPKCDERWQYHDTDWSGCKEKRPHNEHDERFRIDYTGTRYFYERVELRESSVEKIEP